MENSVFPHKAVKAVLQKMEHAALYLDAEKKYPAQTKANQETQMKLFQQNAMPYFAVVAPNGTVTGHQGFEGNPEKFAAFLESAYQKALAEISK